ncbi:LysR substrate-binding domain-containing protein [Acuticoccus sp. MNP-M23]|uniref:LysR family transcriptional regulator n=1 Tax=Acuticoccus sp. MNP-M23 TaxID=3072793 RepID=UPI002815E0BF|nr:LysR substrate-binding domain-containing protein [Acuticoccus sp. MNP-M23]WMS41632.1 LysR substrate-binding domain-containing protein [Acuticoccus sp. MNP-M23]
MMKLLRFRDLEYFIAIAEHGSFSRAAEACGISQPTLSAQLRRMEELLGLTLVERRHGAATVTAEGSEVLSAAREIMDSFYRVQRTTSGDGILLGRPVRFGVLPTIAPYFAPRFLGMLAALNEDSNIDFVEDKTDALELAVGGDSLDFAITATLPRVQSLVALPLAEERLVAVSTAPLPSPATVDDLTGPLLLMQEGHCFREVVSEAIRRARARDLEALTTRIGPSSFATLLSLVRSGMGQTIMPEPFVRENHAAMAGLHTALLEPAGEGRQLQLIVRRGRERYRDVQRLADASMRALLPDAAAA